jgi:hypothetical protein
VDPNTVVFQLKGAGLRIPYELIRKALGRHYDGPVYIRPSAKGRSVLVLEPEIEQSRYTLKGWKSSETSKSLLISTGGIRHALNKTMEDLAGKEYRARVESGKIFVSLARAINRRNNAEDE